MAATELGTSGCSPARRTSSVRIVSVSASVVDAKTPHSSIVSCGAPSGEPTVLATPRPVRSDLMLDRRFPMWDMQLPSVFGYRQQSGAGLSSADQAWHESAPAVQRCGALAGPTTRLPDGR